MSFGPENSNREKYENAETLARENRCHDVLSELWADKLRNTDGKVLHKLNPAHWVVDWVAWTNSGNIIFLEHRHRNIKFKQYKNLRICAHKMNKLRELAREYNGTSGLVADLEDGLYIYKVEKNYVFTEKTVWWGRNESRDKFDTAIAYELEWRKFKQVHSGNISDSKTTGSGSVSRLPITKAY